MVDSKQGIHTNYNFSSVLLQYFIEEPTYIMHYVSRVFLFYTVSVLRVLQQLVLTLLDLGLLCQALSKWMVRPSTDSIPSIFSENSVLSSNDPVFVIYLQQYDFFRCNIVKFMRNLLLTVLTQPLFTHLNYIFYIDTKLQFSSIKVI
jgi:hypothetical protein